MSNKKNVKKHKFLLTDIPLWELENDKGIISEDKKMQKIYEKLVKKYGPALKKLADN